MKIFKRKWIDSLRSGEYKQGREVLYDPLNDSYNCLGVLCERMNLKKFVDGPHCLYIYDRQTARLTIPFNYRKDVVGLSIDDQSIIYKMNTVKSFMEISNFIEKEF